MERLCAVTILKVVVLLQVAADPFFPCSGPGTQQAPGSGCVATVALKKKQSINGLLLQQSEGWSGEWQLI
jgi:hypothetical protein